MGQINRLVELMSFFLQSTILIYYCFLGFFVLVVFDWRLSWMKIDVLFFNAHHVRSHRELHSHKMRELSVDRNIIFSRILSWYYVKHENSQENLEFPHESSHIYISQYCLFTLLNSLDSFITEWMRDSPNKKQEDRRIISLTHSNACILTQNIKPLSFLHSHLPTDP